MSLAATKILMGSGDTEATDDDFNLVTQLYQFDGSNGAQNNTFLDSSSNAGTVTTSGDPVQGTFSPFSAEEGKWGVEFTEDNSDFLSFSNSDFTFGTGDYTVECFVFFTGNDTTSGGIFQTANSGTTTAPAMALRDTTGLTIYTSSGQKITGNNGTFALGVWYHLAFVRASSVIKVYKDGSLVTWDDGTTSVTDTTNITGTGFAIGRYYSNDYTLDGYISNFRVTKSAVYTGAFSKPTTPLTDITNTVLLTCRNNRFMDASSEANTVSIGAGTPKIKPFSPFAPNSSYSAADHGGSAYFNSAYTSLAANSDFNILGNGTFTVEFWSYVDTYNGSYADHVGVFDGSTAGWLIYQYGSNLTVYINNAAVITTTRPPARAWNHIALTRDGTTLRLSINGALVGSSTASLGSDQSQPLRVGGDTGGGRNGLEGYISNFRLVKGTRVYASNFTPPTAPVTAITNTEALLNFTNAAMFDQARKTNLKTIGNTQLSTSVKKFGTASAKFDETGDTATIRDSLYLAGGDYTIEGFVYFNSAPTDGQGLFVFDSQSLNNRAGYGPALGTYAHAPYAGKWHSYYGTQASTGTGTQGNSETTPSGTTWIHFAYVRTSGVIKIFINGSQIGSNINFSNIYSANNIITLGGYYSSSYLLNGYLDSWRVTLKARYTSNFTAPTEAFPNR